MDRPSDRRTFLKVAGVAAIGAGCAGPLLSALASAPGGATDKTKPRWAIVIDTKKCERGEGCTKCMDACHLAHNVPKIDSAREEIKWIWKVPYENAFPESEQEYLREDLRQRPTVILCNHCENPPCVRVCPTRSTWKREDGIVMMDMHRCIGCRYCIVACPYGARSFNWRDPWPREGDDGKPWPNGEPTNPDYPTRTRGVVEKCNFCAERLAKGELPACVEACEHGAIMFGDVNDPESEVRKLLDSRYTTRRRPGLGTNPHVFYLV